jgi:hypothetical protein
MRTVALVALCGITAGCSASSSKKSNDEFPPAPALVLSESGFASPNVNVEFAWSAVEGATGYRVYWQTTPGVTAAAPNVIEVGEELDAMAAIPACTATIYAAIAAVGRDGEGALSAQVDGRFCPGGCERPAGYPDPDVIVNPDAGDDATTLPACFPFATLAAGLAGTASGDVVFATGDLAANDLVIPEGVTLVGDPSAPGATTLDGSGATASAIALSAGAKISGFTVTAPALDAIVVNGANAQIDRVHTTGSANGVKLTASGTSITGLVSTLNTSAGVIASIGSESWSASISSSMLTNNAVGLYVDSFYVSSSFPISSSTIACNSSQDIHAYVPDLDPVGASLATITFAFSNLTMDTAPARREESIGGCPTMGVELCVPQTADLGETPGVVHFNENGVNPVVAICP